MHRFLRALASGLAAVVLTGGAVIGGGAVADPAAAVGSGWPARMLEKINAVRAQAGVRPVVWCPALGESAQQAAISLARAHTISHDAAGAASLYDRIGVGGYRPKAGGENLAGGFDTVVRVMRGWRKSPSHLATITDPRYTHVGFAFVESGDDVYGEYWVQHFGVGGRCS